MAPRVKKPREHSDDDLKTKKSFFRLRFPGFKKKATELSVLCGNSVGFVCYGPEKDLHVWPEPRERLSEIVTKFNEQSDLKKKKNSRDLNDFLNFEALPLEELRTHLSNLKSTSVGVRCKKIEVVKKTIKGSKGMVTEEQPRVSENSAVSDQIRVSAGEQLGFVNVIDELGCVIGGGATEFESETLRDMVSGDQVKVSGHTQSRIGGGFDELGYVVSGCTSAPNFESGTLMVNPEDDCTLLDPATFGFFDYETEHYSTPFTYDLPMVNSNSCDLDVETQPLAFLWDMI